MRSSSPSIFFPKKNAKALVPLTSPREELSTSPVEFTIGKDGSLAVHVTARSPVDIEMLKLFCAKLQSDLEDLQFSDKKNNFTRTYTFEKVVEPVLVISATFSAQSLLPSLNPLLQEFSAAKAVVTYNDFSHQLLHTHSQFRENKRGMNLLLFRFDDFYNSHLDLQAFQENLNGLIEQIVEYSSVSNVPLLLCCCPSSILHAEEEKFFIQKRKIEEKFLEHVFEKRLAYIVQHEELKTYYPVNEIFNFFAEKEALLPYTQDYFTVLSKIIARKYYAFSTSPKKVLVVDCDDTLWKGKIGEDGLDGIVIDASRRYLQEFLVRKSKEGFLLCLCSKNNEEDVWTVFDEKKDMLLKREHITDWRINWEKKSENIQSLSNTLGLGLDSFIFIDDDPAQIGEVSMTYPEVLSLQLPTDEASIPFFLNSIWGLELLDPVSIEKSPSRTRHYQNNTKRKDLRQRSGSFGSYLKQLNLETNIRPIDEKDYSRAATLMQRSNQFNFNKWSPEECSEVRLRSLIKNQGYHCLVVDVKDRYDDYGLVGLMLYQITDGAVLVEAFVLSCRAMGKGVEHQMLKKISEVVLTYDQSHVYILFQATQKNQPAYAFLKQVGFIEEKKEEHRTIYCLSTDMGLEVSPVEWGQEEKSESVATTVPVASSASLNQNFFIKQMLEEALNGYTVTPLNNNVSVPRSVGQTVEYIKRLFKEISFHSTDREASFVELGMDSTMAVQFLSKIYKDYAVHLQYVDILKADCTLKTFSEFLYEKISTKKEISNFTAKTGNERLPLSREQQRLWSAYRQNPHSSKYNMSITYQLSGNLNFEALQQAFYYLLQKENIFCTVFEEGPLYPVQQVIPGKSAQFRCEVEDRQGVQLTQIEREINEFIAQPFYLEKDFLLRVKILRLSDEQWVFSLCVPHIIHDAVSLGILITKLQEYYFSFSHNKKPEEIDSHQYSDYVNWQQSESSSVALNHQAYWQQQLSDISNPVLPIMKKEAATQRNKRVVFYLEEELTSQIESVASQAYATSYHVLLTIFNVFLSKYTGQLNTLVITPTSGRQHPDSGEMIGFFVNLILIVARLNEKNNFFQTLSDIGKTVSEGLTHQSYPFIDLLSFIENADTASLPVSFVFQNYRPVSLSLPGVTCTKIFSDNNSLLYDMASETRLGPLAMYMGKEGQQFTGMVEYDEALFTEEGIKQFIAHFKILISKIMSDPNKPVLNHSLLSEFENNQILRQWSGYPDDVKTMNDVLWCFVSQVYQHPHHIAIKTEDGEEMSYSELDRRSTHLSNHLSQHLSLSYEDRIAICLPRNAYEAIAILAILKAGCAYVPINPRDPRERIQYILEDTQAKAVLVSTQQETSLNFSNFEKISVDKESLWDDLSPRTSLSYFTMNADQLACIMYTSGSTGHPKGVMIEQQGIVRLVVSSGYVEITSHDKIAQLSNSSFDAATFELWGALLNGATLVYPKQNVLLDSNELSLFLSSIKITISFITAALFEALAFIDPSIFKNLKYLLSGGDVLNPKAVSAILNCPQGRPQYLLNGYGPTENTTFSAVHKIENVSENASIPIGRPINQTDIYVLDAQLQPVPVGVTGYLYLGGVGLARGYLNQPALTQSRFPEIVLPTGEKKRLYNTGDVVYWLPDGTLGYVGRADNQIKLRGYRIDIREIEQRLLMHPAIKQAIVIFQKEGIKKLVGYFVTYDNEANIDIGELKNFLMSALPEYMIPTILIQKAELPITVNGKIDRAALSRLKIDHAEKNSSPSPIVGPNMSTEKCLVQLITDMLGCGRETAIDASCSLFDFGVSSIELIRLLKIIYENFSVQLSASEILATYSIRQIAESIDRKKIPKMLVVSPQEEASFVTIQEGNFAERLPLILIHPAGGITYCYKELLANLDKRQPCYIIEDPSLSKKQMLWKSISEMAGYYLELIEKFMPAKSEVVLGGWSSGGMVAVEMSLQNKRKQNSGINIKSLILLDTWLVSTLDTGIKEILKQRIIQQYISVNSDRVDAYVLDIFSAHQEQGFAYQPSQLIDTPILLCKAEKSHEIINMVSSTNYWERFVSHLDVKIVEGDHDTMLNSHCVVGLAKKITDYIKEISSFVTVQCLLSRSVFSTEKTDFQAEGLPPLGFY